MSETEERGDNGTFAREAPAEGQAGRRDRFYADASLFTGCEDKAFGVASRRIVNRFQSGAAILLLSDLTLQELEGAPDSIIRLVKQVPAQNLEHVIESEAARTLAAAYLESNVIPPSRANDARHVALATLSRADLLASWNYEDMTNSRLMQAVNEVNRRNGQAEIDIRAPWAIDRAPDDVGGFDCVAYTRRQRDRGAREAAGMKPALPYHPAMKDYTGG